jgi:hypothetical protein
MENIMDSNAVEIGKTIRQARIDHGFKSRAALVGTRKLKGKITQEGLRKIEQGERVPRLENLRALAETLEIGSKNIRKLERMALEANVARVTRRAGNATVTFQIEGKPLRIDALPPKRKMENFVRGTVTQLVDVVNKYGILDADVDHFRRHARSILLKQLEQ